MTTEITGFCMKCRMKRVIADPTPITHKNGKAAVKGTCSICGTKVYRMGTGKKAATASAPSSEGAVTTKAPSSKGKGSKKGSKSKILQVD